MPAAESGKKCPLLELSLTANRWLRQHQPTRPLDNLVAALDTARQTPSSALSHLCVDALLAGHIAHSDAKQLLLFLIATRCTATRRSRRWLSSTLSSSSLPYALSSTRPLLSLLSRWDDHTPPLCALRRLAPCSSCADHALPLYVHVRTPSRRCTRRVPPIQLPPSRAGVPAIAPRLLVQGSRH